MAKLVFEGEEVDPDNQIQCDVIRAWLHRKIYEVAKKDRAWMAFGHETEDVCRATACLAPDRVPIMLCPGSDGYISWWEIPVERAIEMYDWDWRVGNVHGELNAVDMLARSADPYHLTLYDRPD